MENDLLDNTKMHFMYIFSKTAPTNLKIYVYGLNKLIKIRKILSSFCATAMENSSKFMTHSSLVIGWTTELGGVGQKVWSLGKGEL